ncbi:MULTISPECIES: hypothetical protein [unclassified Sporosarcina]|uniref:hypothetical protein n=1 Tax=unclassified Sporosarcina TaxID=2647733 RepID=UPI00203A7C8F|nr:MULTISPECIES: hypothetical protein [unclassified Sporosarcina]GKV65292.1 hypothetical protein NCCP2331_14450 [Sporosarcina sp. NCCP-2331]GLB55416.1 hypothetical protein NCCP2378_12030 [Sporosarcina sp. NCCP-2378]
MNRIIIYLGAACFAFTFSSLFYFLFRLLGIFPPLTEETASYLFINSCLITLLIFLSHKLPVDQPLVVHLIELICVLAVLILAGAIFHMYPFTAFYVGTVALCGIFAYSFVILMIYMNNKMAEKAINQAIASQRRRDSNV